MSVLKRKKMLACTLMNYTSLTHIENAGNLRNEGERERDPGSVSQPATAALSWQRKEAAAGSSMSNTFNLS